MSRVAWHVRRLRQRRFIDRLRRDGVDLGPGVILPVGTKVEPPVAVGRGTWIGRGCVLRGRSPITIGNYCELGEGVGVHSSNHELIRANLSGRAQHQFTGAGLGIATRGPVEIGHNVWVGNKAMILSGVTVGSGAAIGGGSVVTRDVEPFSIVAGNPAKPIRKRFSDEVIELLLDIAWWDWPEVRLKENAALLEADLTSEDAVRLLEGFRRNNGLGEHFELSPGA